MYLLLNHSFKRFIKKTLIHPVMKQVKYFLNESLSHSLQPTQRNLEGENKEMENMI